MKAAILYGLGVLILLAFAVSSKGEL